MSKILKFENASVTPHFRMKPNSLSWPTSHWEFGSGPWFNFFSFCLYLLFHPPLVILAFWCFLEYPRRPYALWLLKCLFPLPIIIFPQVCRVNFLTSFKSAQISPHETQKHYTPDSLDPDHSFQNIFQLLTYYMILCLFILCIIIHNIIFVPC